MHFLYRNAWTEIDELINSYILNDLINLCIACAGIKPRK